MQIVEDLLHLKLLELTSLILRYLAFSVLLPSTGLFPYLGQVSVPSLDVIQSMLGSTAVNSLEEPASTRNPLILNDVVDLVKQEIVELVDHLRSPILQMEVLLILRVSHVLKKSQVHVFSSFSLEDQSVVVELLSNVLVVFSPLVLLYLQLTLLCFMIINLLLCDIIHIHLMQVIIRELLYLMAVILYRGAEVLQVLLLLDNRLLLLLTLVFLILFEFGLGLLLLLNVLILVSLDHFAVKHSVVQSIDDVGCGFIKVKRLELLVLGLKDF